MMLKVLLAGVHSEDQMLLTTIMETIPGIKVIGEMDNGLAVLSAVEALQPDVVLLDIDTPELIGLKTAKAVSEINSKTNLILATGSSSYIRDALEVCAYDYLVKPFNPARVKQTLKRLVRIQRSLTNSVGMKLAVEDSNLCKFINVEDILFITKVNRKTVIHTKTGVFNSNDSLTRLEKLLADNVFFRCHKGYIINAKMVTAISPWGAKTYVANLADTGETVLMTMPKVKEFQKRYCLG